MKYLASFSIPNEGGNPINITSVGNIPSGGVNTLFKIIGIGIEFVFIIAIIFCLFVIIYSGYQWMTSVGDKQKLAQARQKLSYAIVGLVIVLLSFFIINLVLGFFNINILNILG